MQYKRGTELRTELKNIKQNFYNDLLRIEKEIKLAIDSSINDSDISEKELYNFNKYLFLFNDNIKFFNIQHLKIALYELNAIKTTIEQAEMNIKRKEQARIIIFDVFSEREIEIFNLIVEGMTAQKIAQKLFITKSAVENTTRNMLIKIENNKILSAIIDNSPKGKIFLNKDCTKYRYPKKLFRYIAEILNYGISK